MIITYEFRRRIEERLGPVIRRRTFQFRIFRHRFPAREHFFEHRVGLYNNTETINKYTRSKYAVSGFRVPKCAKCFSPTWSTSSRTDISWKATQPSSWQRFRPSAYVTIRSYCWSTLLPTSITGTSNGWSCAYQTKPGWKK